MIKNLYKPIRPNGWWWVKTKDAGIVPDYSFNGHFSDDDGIVEVLEPCDYNEFKKLKEALQKKDYKND